jgi:hypothetical protein
MGIRFLCTACHKKLNVKGFLAGKKGVCPKCGASILIPEESQLPSKGAVAGGSLDAAAVGEGPMQPFSPSSPAAVESPVAAPAQPSHVVPATSVPATRVPAEQPISQPFPQAIQSPAHPAGAPAPVATAPAVPAMPNPALSNPALPNPALPNPALPIPVAVSPSPAGVSPVSVAPATATPAATPVSAPSPPTAPQLDPFNEDPNLIWYVRPPSGGQFGPAKGEIMRKWIEEGRVSEDSLVWREGWADWQKACEAIPSLAPADSVQAQTATQAVASRTAGSAATAHRSRRRKNSQLALVSVIMLVLVSLALLVTLIVKLQG